MTALEILRLDSNCLFCQGRVIQVSNDRSSEMTTWKRLCAESICQSLQITHKPICSVWFKRGSYCLFCYQLFCDFEYVERKIRCLQKRLYELSETAEDLLQQNNQDLESNPNKTGEEYFEAIKCIGRELRSRDKVNPNEDIENDVQYPFLPQNFSQSDNIEPKDEPVSEPEENENQITGDNPVENFYDATGNKPNDENVEPERTEPDAEADNFNDENEIGNNENSSFPNALDESSEFEFEGEPNSCNEHEEDPITIGNSDSQDPEPIPIRPFASNINRNKTQVQRAKTSAKLSLISSIAPGSKIKPRPTRIAMASSNHKARKLPPIAIISTAQIPRTSNPAPIQITSASFNMAQGPGATSAVNPAPIQITSTPFTMARVSGPISAVQNPALIRIGPAPVSMAPMEVPCPCPGSINIPPLTRIPPAQVPMATGLNPTLIRIAPAPTVPSMTPVPIATGSAPFPLQPTFMTFWVTDPVTGAGSLIQLPNLNITQATTNYSAITATTSQIAPTNTVNTTQLMDISDDNDVTMVDAVNNVPLGVTPPQGTSLAPGNSFHIVLPFTQQGSTPFKKVPMKRSPRPRKGIYCTYPNCNFKRNRPKERYVEAHIRGVHEADPTPWHCTSCDEKFKNVVGLEFHLAKCHRDPIPCPLCPNRFFPGKNRLNSHLQHAHPFRSYARCKFCNKIIPKEEDATVHEALHKDHSDLTGYACVLCQNSFVTQIELEGHVGKNHEDEFKKHPCPICGENFFTYYQLKGHKRSFHGQGLNPKFKCQVEGCNYHGQSETNTKLHQRSHSTEKPFQCTWKDCRVKFKTEPSVDKHIARHKFNENLIEAKYTCSICSKGFISKYSYVKHMNVHAASKRFLCDQCPMAFHNGQNLNKHLWAHKRRQAIDREMDSNTQEKSQIIEIPSADNEASDAEKYCLVCGEATTLVRSLGALTCTPCRLFFEYNTRMETDTTVRRVKVFCPNGNCEITPGTRGNCQDCRLKKCRAVGLTLPKVQRRLRPLCTTSRGHRNYTSTRRALHGTMDTPRGKLPPRGSEECPVCRTSAYLFEACGIRACTNCRTFFREAVSKKRVFSCYYDNKCTPRSWGNGIGKYCSQCRYDRCITLGMKPDLVPIRKCSNVGKCSICEKECVELRNPYGALACHRCCWRLWSAVRRNRATICSTQGNCIKIKCHGCLWIKALQVGFQPELVKRSTFVRKKSGPSDNQNENPTCMICGDIGKYKRRNGYACNGCMVFFYKITAKETVPACDKGGNCTIDILTRTNCLACRLQKCIKFEMRRQTTFKKRAEPRNWGNCAVCGDVAIGIRYGVISCDSCMFFFLKADGRDFGECQNGGECEITKQTRSKCQFCRLVKCHNVGMQNAYLMKRNGKRWGKIARESAEAEAIRQACMANTAATTSSTGPQCSFDLGSPRVLPDTQNEPNFVLSVPQDMW